MGPRWNAYQTINRRRKKVHDPHPAAAQAADVVFDQPAEGYVVTPEAGVVAATHAAPVDSNAAVRHAVAAGASVDAAANTTHINLQPPAPHAPAVEWAVVCPVIVADRTVVQIRRAVWHSCAVCAGRIVTAADATVIEQQPASPDGFAIAHTVVVSRVVADTTLVSAKITVRHPGTV